jgi:hypothetical protein
MGVRIGENGELAPFLFEQVLDETRHIDAAVLLDKIDIDDESLVGIAVLDQDNGAVALPYVEEDCSDENFGVSGPKKMARAVRAMTVKAAGNWTVGSAATAGKQIGIQAQRRTPGTRTPRRS